MPQRAVSAPIRTFGPALLWVVTAAWMVWDAIRDLFDPTRQDTRRYGHNGQGALWQGLAVTFVELAVFYALVRPWKGGRHWPRIMLALAAWTPWTLVSALATMHAGGIFALHFFWLLAMTVVLVVALLVTIVSSIASRSLPA